MCVFVNDRLDAPVLEALAAHAPRREIASGMANDSLAALTGGRAEVIKPAASPAKPAPAPKPASAPQASARPAGSGNPLGQAQLRLPQSSMPCVIKAVSLKEAQLVVKRADPLPRLLLDRRLDPAESNELLARHQREVWLFDDRSAAGAPYGPLLTRLGEVAAWRGHPEKAEQHYRAALALGIDDGYLLAAWSDFLLDRSRPAEVLKWLAGWESSDGLLLRLAIAGPRPVVPLPGRAQLGVDRAARRALVGGQARRERDERREEERAPHMPPSMPALGMTSVIPKFDGRGTFVGSSYVYATARDFARFGRLYLDDGVTADGTRILPVGWRDHARTQVAVDEPTDGGVAFGYGRQWWLWPQFAGSLACHGYEGQYTVVVPDRDLVVVHLGKSPVDARGSLVAALAHIVEAFPVA